MFRSSRLGPTACCSLSFTLHPSLTLQACLRPWDFDFASLLVVISKLLLGSGVVCRLGFKVEAQGLGVGCCIHDLGWSPYSS